MFNDQILHYFHVFKSSSSSFVFHNVFLHTLVICLLLTPGLYLVVLPVFTIDHLLVLLLSFQIAKRNKVIQIYICSENNEKKSFLLTWHKVLFELTRLTTVSGLLNVLYVFLSCECFPVLWFQELESLPANDIGVSSLIISTCQYGKGD